ncbi:MAG: hypothetical protein ACO263_02695 [Cyclobacteriaceae bacterium]
MLRLLIIGVIVIAACSSQAWAQKRSVANEVTAFQNKHPRTRLVLFLSQDKVTPGDTIRFHAAVYEPSGKIFAQRQILNLELADQAGRIIHRQNALLATGQTDSYLVIPVNIPEGFFLLRAFTNWMRNFGEETFFFHTLEVVRERSLQPPPAVPFISIHPEGGNLIAEALNHLVIRYQALPLGSPIKIIGSRSGELGIVYAVASGISTLSIKPKEGEDLEAQTSAGLKSLSLAAKSDGVSVYLREREGMVRIAFPPKRFSSKDLHALLLGKGEARELFAVSEYTDSIYYQLPQRRDHGYYQILILDAARKIVAARQWAVLDEQPVVRIELKNSTPGLRTTTDAEIILNDDRGRPLRGTFQVSVTDDRVHTSLSSAGPLSLLQKYQGNSIPLHFKNALTVPDDLVAVQENWLPANWNDQGYRPPYPFQSILRFSGSVQRRDGGSFRDSTTVMLFLQNKLMGYEVDIKDGSFDSPVYFDFTGEDKLFYSVHRKDSTIEAVLRLDRDSVSSQRAPQHKVLFSRDGFADFMIRKKATDKSYRFFRSATTTLPVEQPDPNSTFEQALQGADVSVQIDDYVVFPTLEDVIREIVPALKHRKSNGRSAVRVFLYSPVLTNTPILSTGDPLYIIDGQMTKDTDYFMGIDPAELISIRIVRNVQKLARFGYLGRNGVVLVKTRNPKAITEFEANSILTVNGLNASVSSSETVSNDPRVPDLRLVLDWRSSQQTDNQGRYSFRFTTGDVAGPFKVRIEGVTEDGRPFFAEHSFEVREK